MTIYTIEVCVPDGPYCVTTVKGEQWEVIDKVCKYLKTNCDDPTIYYRYCILWGENLNHCNKLLDSQVSKCERCLEEGE